MNYKAAQEGIAEQYFHWRFADDVAFKTVGKETKRICNAFADAALLKLYTPEEIEEWKKGGYPAIVCKDQSLPDCEVYRWIDLDEGGWKYDKELMANTCPVLNAGFRRVKGGEG